MHYRRDIDIQAELNLTRRSFLNTAASGVGGILSLIHISEPTRPY